MQTSLWWRETGRLYIRYLTVAGASLPLAIVYSYLAARGIDHWFFSAPLLIAGYGCGLFGWRFSERFFRLKPEKIGPNSLIIRVAAVAMSATFAVLCTENASLRPVQAQGNLSGERIQASAAATVSVPPSIEA